MSNKLLLFIVLFLANLIANAQYIKLEKMNSLDKKTIQLPKKIKLVYQTDSLSFKQKVNVSDYHFPYVTVVKNKKDTLLLNVKNISYLKIGTPLRNPVLVLSTFITSVTTLAGLAVGDQLKSDAAETITNLKSMGITPWLVTGDSAEVAAAVALTVGIDSEHVVSEAMPETKLVIVEKLKAEGHCVLMIGDGINDAAALTAADLSMAMGTGTDTAISSADITLMNSGLGSVISALKLSQKTLKIIRLNMGWALIYNVIGLPIAALGYLQPIYAAGAMALSSLFVVTNSLRIK